MYTKSLKSVINKALEAADEGSPMEDQLFALWDDSFDDNDQLRPEAIINRHLADYMRNLHIKLDFKTKEDNKTDEELSLIHI